MAFLLPIFLLPLLFVPVQNRVFLDPQSPTPNANSPPSDFPSPTPNANAPNAFSDLFVFDSPGELALLQRLLAISRSQSAGLGAVTLYPALALDLDGDGQLEGIFIRRDLPIGGSEETLLVQQQQTKESPAPVEQQKVSQPTVQHQQQQQQVYQHKRSFHLPAVEGLYGHGQHLAAEPEVIPAVPPPAPSLNLKAPFGASQQQMLLRRRRQTEEEDGDENNNSILLVD